MAVPVACRYDLFISYAGADAAWVDGYLRPALGLAPTRILTVADFQPGAVVVEEFERAVRSSRYTLLVLSPAYLADEWAVFGSQLAAYAAVAEQRDRLIPLRRHPATLPLAIEFRVSLDCTDETNWNAAIARLRALLEQPEPPAEDIPCPYPGMVRFTEKDAAYFYGRAAEIDKMLQHFRVQRFLMVIGPSGSGKSSLVYAGLLPQLQTSPLWAKDFWVVRDLRPGDNPLIRLTEALGGDPAQPGPVLAALLAAHPPGQRVLLVVDQFEELFTQAAKPDQAAFVAALRALRADERCAVLLAMRADFYPDLMNSDLWPVDASQRLEIAAPRGAALRQAIVQPAADVGVYLEAGLPEQLLADAANEPGVLPLLQETLLLLWAHRERRFLPLSAYASLGRDGRSGLAVALATQADAALADLSPAQQAIARRIFLRLVQFGEGRPDTRRQQPAAALRVSTDDPLMFDQTLQNLAAHRLLTLSGEDKPGAATTVDIAHEALIVAWPAFQDWIRERRAAEQTRRRLEDKAAEWVRLGRGAGGLLDAAELPEAEAWLAGADAADLGYSADLPALVHGSRAALEADSQAREAARQRELALERRARLRLQGIVGILATLLLISAVLLARPYVLAQMAQGAWVSFQEGAAVIGADESSDANPEEKPRWIADIPPFAIQRFEASNDQYRLCTDAGTCTPPVDLSGLRQFYDKTMGDDPVAGVTGVQAATYCRWLGKRLPTELEWERAARGSNGRQWPWGSDPPTAGRANVIISIPASSPAGPWRVQDGASGQSPEGLYNLVGNVWEWTSTYMTLSYTEADYNQGVWDGLAEDLRTDHQLVLRGGGWKHELARVTQRGSQDGSFADSSVGIRCASGDQAVAKRLKTFP